MLFALSFDLFPFPSLQASFSLCVIVFSSSGSCLCQPLISSNLIVQGLPEKLVVSRDADCCLFNDPMPPERCPLAPLCPVCKLFLGEHVNVNKPPLNRTDISSAVPVVHQDWIVFFHILSGLLLVVPQHSWVCMSLVAILRAPDQSWHCLVVHLFGLLLESFLTGKVKGVSGQRDVKRKKTRKAITRHSF